MNTIVKLSAFHSDSAVKEKYLARIRAHAAADNLIQGTGWSNGKGCAVGCTLEAYDHSLYPIELGLPEWLARLEDSIFEGLPAELAMTWPDRFLSAIPVGSDLEPVRHKLAIARLGRLITLQESNLGKHGEEVDSAIRQVIKATKQVAACHEAEIGASSCAVDWSAESAARAARSARSAESAARSAWSAESAARSAESARSAAESAAESAWSAAESARSARSAAWSAESAAWSAAESARSAAESAAESAWSAAESARSARSAAWIAESETLLSLLAQA